MNGRIVVFGATGYTGRLTVEALVRRGARPVLAGRNRSVLDTLAAAHGGLDVAVADVGNPATVRALVDRGDVLVTTVGPFSAYGEPAVRAAIDAGAWYLDSTGEAAFVRRVFGAWGAEAAASGAGLVTAFGYDYVPGNVAGGLALRDAGEAAVRVDVGYFFTGRARPSAGTFNTLLASTGAAAHAFRDGRVVEERTARSVRSFRVRGRDRAAISIGATEQYALPRLAPQLREVSVYLGWFGPLSRVMQAATAVPGTGRVAPALLRLLPRPGAGEGPDEAARARSGSHVVAIAYDDAGRALAEVHVAGVDGYTFTGEILAWGAIEAAGSGLAGTGALTPIEAFGGLDRLAEGTASAGLDRSP